MGKMSIELPSSLLFPPLLFSWKSPSRLQSFPHHRDCYRNVSVHQYFKDFFLKTRSDHFSGKKRPVFPSWSSDSTLCGLDTSGMLLMVLQKLPRGPSYLCPVLVLGGLVSPPVLLPPWPTGPPEDSMHLSFFGLKYLMFHQGLARPSSTYQWPYSNRVSLKAQVLGLKWKPTFVPSSLQFHRNHNGSDPCDSAPCR